jgi:histone H3/H4
MSRLSFQKVMRNIMKKRSKADLRIQQSVINALQKAIKDFLMKTFESNLIVYIV